jgi:guanylate kinase
MADPQSTDANQEATLSLGPLIVLSGPSGSGKSTVLKRLLAEAEPPLHLSVSATTRPPRPGEVDGVHYHFWTRKRFEEEKQAGAFLEWAEVYGCYYGTLRCEVEPYRRRGEGVILDIDIQGAAAVRRLCPDAVLVFLRTSSFETYERRLRQRGTEDEATIQRRLAGARRELAHAGDYDHQVVNDDLEAAVSGLRAILSGLFSRRNHAG